MKNAEEAALIYLFRCLDERGKLGVMSYITNEYLQTPVYERKQNRRKAAQVNREEDHNAEN